MLKIVEYKDINNEYILIDVRSPIEFKEATIPNAINIPLFTDEDRKVIGYVYVNESIEKAKKLGIEAVSKRLPEIYDKILGIEKKNKKLLFFCARGGMRSSSITALVNSLGINAFKLKGGYKGYRDFINKELPKVNENVKYIVFHGKTGVGKSELLRNLKRRGFNVVDLEEAANHRGSLLGSVGLGNGNSQKQFESSIYESLKNRKDNYVLIEGESKRIGNTIIPDYIFKSMEEGVHVFIDADIEFRCNILVKEYTKNKNCKKEILGALENMGKYISQKNIERYKELVNKEEYNEIAQELMIKYYDPMYMNGMKKYDFVRNFNVLSIEESCDEIEKWLGDISNV